MNKKQTCPWPNQDPLMIAYHDSEWGVPLFDDQKLFEYMVLDAFQAGLSWSTIMNKRENFRKAFDDFDFEKISTYNESKLEELMTNPGIIRNKLKIHATVTNALAFKCIIREFGSFHYYIWNFVSHKPIVNQWKDLSQIPAKSSISDLMSKDLKKRGFKFVGSTICYAFMQAAGLVNDHLVSCFRHRVLSRMEIKDKNYLAHTIDSK